MISIIYTDEGVMLLNLGTDFEVVKNEKAENVPMNYFACKLVDYENAKENELIDLFELIKDN